MDEIFLTGLSINRSVEISQLPEDTLNCVNLKDYNEDACTYSTAQPATLFVSQFLHQIKSDGQQGVRVSQVRIYPNDRIKAQCYTFTTNQLAILNNEQYDEFVHTPESRGKQFFFKSPYGGEAVCIGSKLATYTYVKTYVLMHYIPGCNELWFIDKKGAKHWEPTHGPCFMPTYKMALNVQRRLIDKCTQIRTYYVLLENLE